MADIIHLLPDSVANQIAAGEVIQRPASVVKELVENALDAGATHIDVLITDAGRTCIQVIDNGKGMSETDARLSFERHATSKIREAADLYALHTMGFRGEALASIAAVAQVELKTRQTGEELGTKLCIEGSQVEELGPVACAEGSNFSVKNLFYNVPARRKFLKSNATELSNILTEFERIVLVNPGCSFTFHHNGVEMHNLPECTLRQRIIDVFGRKLNQQLLSLEVETALVKVKGYIGKPENARKKGAHQFFFVNGRYMRHPYFHKAVMEAYEHLIPVGEQVSYFLYFDIDPASIDVNIHPTKTEIKFENEQAIWPILVAAVKESMGKFNAVPTIDFDTEDCPSIPVASVSGPVSMPQVAFNPAYNPFDESRPSRKTDARQWEKLYEAAASVGRESEESAPSLFPEEQEQTAATDESRPERSNTYIQHKGRFVITSVKSGLMVVDQHRAHVRILYDLYMSQLQKRKGHSQGQLFPEIIQFSPAEAAMLEQTFSEFQVIGFELFNLGACSYSINGVPAGTEGIAPAVLLRNMLEVLLSGGGNLQNEVHHRMALSLAQMSAIPIGQVLSQDEMSDLIGKLLASPTPNYTPDGKPVLRIIAEDDIEQTF